MKLRPEMECKLSEIIWFTKDGLDFLEKVFGNAVPRIYPHIGVFKRCEEVRTDWELEYDHTYMDRIWGIFVHIRIPIELS